jgi:hypothetical protein
MESSHSTKRVASPNHKGETQHFPFLIFLHYAARTRVEQMSKGRLTACLCFSSCFLGQDFATIELVTGALVNTPGWVTEFIKKSGKGKKRARVEPWPMNAQRRLSIGCSNIINSGVVFHPDF